MRNLHGGNRFLDFRTQGETKITRSIMKTLPNNYTPRLQTVLEMAQKEATALNHSYVGTEHCMLALLKFGQGVAINALNKAGVDYEKIRENILQELDPSPPPSTRVLSARIAALEAKIDQLLNPPTE